MANSFAQHSAKFLTGRCASFMPAAAIGFEERAREALGRQAGSDFGIGRGEGDRQPLGIERLGGNVSGERFSARSFDAQGDGVQGHILEDAGQF